MIQDIDPKLIDTHYIPKRPTPDAYVLCYRGIDPLLKRTDDAEQPFVPPTVQDWLDSGLKLDEISCAYLFRVDGADYFWLDEELPAIELFTLNSRALRTMGVPTMRWAIALGTQFVSWYESTRFCPRCGHKLQHGPKSRELVCESCANIIYPRINPAIIVAITSGDYILVTQYADRSFKHTALVAGYVEVGETPEQCCRREALEEVGIELKDLRYVCSQPWPHSSSLLMGFVAEVENCPKPQLRDGELREAIWVHKNEVAPWVENTATLTNTLIDMFGKDQL